ncbi:hypothetical protein ACFQY7_16590 [Actinomadura luteofluorescens]|uniref:hypothetical protein n=1 Tax=Actinomadura luteofluorescens TaxID=46163 RepID=UPI003629C600
MIDAVPVADPRVTWKAVAPLRRGPGGTFPDAACPVPGSPCSRHGSGLHQIGPERLVACTVR